MSLQRVRIGTSNPNTTRTSESGHERRGPYRVVRLFPQLKDARPSTQVRWCDHAHRPGGDVGASRDGARAIGGGQDQRPDRGDLLHPRRTGLGAAGDAAYSLDAAARMKAWTRRPPAINLDTIAGCALLAMPRRSRRRSACAANAVLVVIPARGGHHLVQTA